MKRMIPTLLFSLLIACSGDKKDDINYITDYYPKIYEAEAYYHQKQYQKAFDSYKEAFESGKPKNTLKNYEMNKFAEVSARLGKEEIALDYIEKNINQGLLLQTFLQNSVYSEVLNTDRGKKIIADYNSNRSAYLASLDLELRSEIQGMIQEDQALVGDQEKREEVFEKNTKRLIEIFEELGYPGDQMIGPYNIDFSNSDITILLMHTSDSIRVNYFIPKLKEYVKEGVCDPETLGAVIDNLHLYNGELQIMGTYENREENMISDIEQVNENRRSIGLPVL